MFVSATKLELAESGLVVFTDGLIFHFSKLQNNFGDPVIGIYALPQIVFLQFGMSYFCITVVFFSVNLQVVILLL